MKLRNWAIMLLPGLLLASLAAAENYLSPLVLTADREGKTLYVAESGANQVAVFDVGGTAVAKALPVPGTPGGLALSPDGKLLYVTEAAPQGRVHALDLAAGTVAFSVPVGHTPGAPVLSPDGASLFVCNRFNNNVSVVDIASKAETARIPVSREPVAAAVTPDGKSLFVANLLPAGTSDGDYSAAVVSVIDTASRQVAVEIKLPNGCSSLRGLCISPDGAFVYVTHLLSRYQLPTTQLERGWMNTNAISVVDAAQRTLVNTVLLDDVDLGAANPWGVACSGDGKFLCVAQAGTHEISVIDRAGLQDKLAKVAAGEKVSEVSQTAADVPNDLAFLVGLKRRIALKGNGPRGLAVVGATAYAAEYFTDSLGVVNIDPASRAEAKSIALGPKTEMTAVRKGEMFFNDAGLCFQHWQSCESCHPDARVDGLNWDLMNDGIGNPKNTRSMLMTHQTPPVMSLGVRETAEKAVRSGIRFIQFAVRPEEDAVAIDEYLKSLKPVPSPYLVDGKPSAAAERGAKLFEQAGCAACHPAPLYTDLQQYNLGLGRDSEKDKSFDTPTLVEVWRTAPYLYDGRAASMRDLFAKFNTEGKHGNTAGLSDAEMNDLIEYVLSR